mgnify:CR=1 FL=1
MKCRWCKGSGGECGCGSGRCEHCNGTGVMTDPPFEQASLQILSDAEVQAFAEYWCDAQRDATLGEFIEMVATRAALRTRRDASGLGLPAPDALGPDGEAMYHGSRVQVWLKERDALIAEMGQEPLVREAEALRRSVAELEKEGRELRRAMRVLRCKAAQNVRPAQDTASKNLIKPVHR